MYYMLYIIKVSRQGEQTEIMMLPSAADNGGMKRQVTN
jgi:hypothetical protein